MHITALVLEADCRDLVQIPPQLVVASRLLVFLEFLGDAEEAVEEVIDD